MIPEQNWQDLAACRGEPVEIFFPLIEHEADPAKRVCAGCDVRIECLETSIAAGETFGIWGGLTTQERKALVTRRRRQATGSRRTTVVPPVL